MKPVNISARKPILVVNETISLTLEMKTKPKITADIEGDDGYSVEGSAKKMLSGKGEA